VEVKTSPVHPFRSDYLHLRAAEGWLELGNWRQANDEVDEISDAFKAHAIVLQLRCEIYKAAKKWDLVKHGALHLNGQFPTQWRFPFLLACSYAQGGDLDSSKTWFQRAMKLNEEKVKLEAVICDDLKPLRDSMSGVPWKGE
jgi:hypothetical protein